MENPHHTDRWHLTDYLITLGMSRDDARAWVKARRKGESFKTNPSDTVGNHLDRIWKRKIQESKALVQLKSTEGIHPQNLRGRLAKWRMAFVIMSVYGILCWTYVIAFQMVNPESVYWPLAVWLPWIRMDYFGETLFIASFIFAMVWVKLHYGRPLARSTETDNNH